MRSNYEKCPMKLEIPTLLNNLPEYFRRIYPIHKHHEEGIKKHLIDQWSPIGGPNWWCTKLYWRSRKKGTFYAKCDLT